MPEGGADDFLRSPPNVWENVRNEILAGRISRRDGRLCKLEVEAHMAGS
jgi:hypothetical protein